MSQRQSRFPAKFPVILRKGPDMFPATICNISMGGGCIIGNYRMSAGETTVIDYSIGQTRATVMWSMGNMAGLRFESQLSNLGLNSIRAMKQTA